MKNTKLQFGCEFSVSFKAQRVVFFAVQQGPDGMDAMNELKGKAAKTDRAKKLRNTADNVAKGAPPSEAAKRLRQLRENSDRAKTNASNNAKKLAAKILGAKLPISDKMRGATAELGGVNAAPAKGIDTAKFNWQQLKKDLTGSKYTPGRYKINVAGKDVNLVIRESKNPQGQKIRSFILIQKNARSKPMLIDDFIKKVKSIVTKPKPSSTVRKQAPRAAAKPKKAETVKVSSDKIARVKATISALAKSPIGSKADIQHGKNKINVSTQYVRNAAGQNEKHFVIKYKNKEQNFKQTSEAEKHIINLLKIKSTT